MAVKKTAKSGSSPKAAASKQAAPKKAVAAPKASAPKSSAPKAAAPKASAPKAAAAAKKTTTAAPKSSPKSTAAPKKKPAPVKLTDKQTELLMKVKGAGETGYAATKAEAKGLESLQTKKLIKRGSKDKASGLYNYSVSKAGEKHISTPAAPKE